MHRPTTLSEWQSMFEGIFGRRNLEVEPVDIWIHVVEELGEIAEDLRKEDFPHLKQNLPDLFAWLCAFANRLEVSLDEVVWRKYPNVCPYCLRQNRCVCIGERYPRYEPGRLAKHRSRTDRKPTTLSSWLAMFRRIYGNVNKIPPRFAIGLHLVEEIGEVSREIRLGDLEACQTEIADVFAWLVAMVMRVRDIDSFDEALWQVYPGVCKSCGNEICTCEAHSVAARTGAQAECPTVWPAGD